MRYQTPWIEIGTALPAVINNNTCPQTNHLNVDTWLAVKKLVKPTTELFLQAALEVDDEDPTLTFNLQYNTFDAALAVEDPTNWTIDEGTTGLTIGAITRVSDTQVTIATTGTVVAGTLSIRAEAACFAGVAEDSETLAYVVGTEPETSSSVVWEEEGTASGFDNDLNVYAVNGSETYFVEKLELDTNAANENYFIKALDVPPVHNIGLVATYSAPQTYALFAKVIQADKGKSEAL